MQSLYLSHHYRCAIVTALLYAGSVGAVRPASAQTVRGKTYFYPKPATIRTDLRDHDVVIGKKPGTTSSSLARIPKPYTVTVADGANISFQSVTKPYQFLSVYNRANLAVTGGTVVVAAVHDQATAVISGGTVQGVQVYDTAAVLVRSGNIGDVTVEGTGTATIVGGTATGQVYTNSSGATVWIKGGTLASVGSAKGGRVNIISGYIKRTDNEGTALIQDGIIGFVSVAKSGNTVIRGGHIQAAHCYHTATLTIEGGSIAYAEGTLESTVTLRQGNVEQFSGGYRGQIHIHGGTITRIIVNDSSTFHLHGGTIRDTIFQQNNHATTHFYGRALSFGNPVSGEGFTNFEKGVYYNVFWTRADGVKISCRYFDRDGNIENKIPQGIKFTKK